MSCASAMFKGCVAIVVWQLAEGFRQKPSAGSRLAASDSSKCDFRCGAFQIDVVSGVVRGSESSHEVEKVTVGAGADYDANLNECLGSCKKVPKGTRGSGYGWTKVATTTLATNRTGDPTKSLHKVYCKVHECTWKPAAAEKEGRWEERLDGDEKLFPLDDFHEGGCYGNTCFCCQEKGVRWGPDVNRKCKLAYGVKSLGSAIAHYSAAAFTMTLSNLWWKSDCRAYCKRYPMYPVAKKAMLAHGWTPPPPITTTTTTTITTIQEPPITTTTTTTTIDLAVEAAQLGAEMRVMEEKVKALLELKKMERGQFGLKQYEEEGEEDQDSEEAMLADVEGLRDALEHAQVPTLAPHMDTELLSNCEKLIAEFDRITMTADLEHGMSRFHEALEAQQQEVTKSVIEQLKAAIFRADEDLVDAELLANARALLEGLESML